MADQNLVLRIPPEMDWSLKQAARIHQTTPSDYVRLAIGQRLATETFGKRKEVDMFMISRPGKPAVDTDKILLLGKPFMKWDRDAAERELLKAGLDVPVGAGLQTMALLWHDWQRRWIHGDGSPSPEAA
jgi:hypothetical protein